MLAPKPSSVGFEEAAALPLPGLTAMGLVEATDPKEGETVLVVGANGAVGSYVAQIAAPVSSRRRA
jgi:NADPH2:quinone reductase